MLVFKDDFSTLVKMGYHTDIYCKYFFKIVEKWGGVFIDKKTREISIEGCGDSSPNVIQELEKLKQYIEEKEDDK